MSPVIVDRPPETEPSTGRWSVVSGRWLLVIASLVAPALSAATPPGRFVAWEGAPRAPDWLIAGNASYPFAPLWLYAALSLAGAVYSPQRAGCRFSIRFGVYSGNVLALHAIAAWIARFVGGLTVTSFVIAGVALTVFLWSVVWPERKWLWRAMPGWFWMLAAAVLATIASLGQVVYLFVLLPLVSLPFVSLAAYLAVSMAVYQRHGGGGQFELGQSLWLVTWAGAYAAAWRTILH